MVCCLGLTVAAQENVRGARKVIVSPEVNGTSVTLRLVAPNARRVVVQGGWLPMMSPGADMTLGNDTVWTYTANNLASDQYRYNFIVDGTRIIDPNNVFMIRDVGSLFSLFNVSGGVGDYYMVKDVPHGNVTRTWYHSATFGVDRRLTVYTPAGYDSKKSYPVFYLLHGSGGDEEAWITQGCVARIMDNLIAEGKAVPMIVVMPNGNPDKQAAGVINQGDNENPVLLSVRRFKIGTDTAVPAPDFIDVRAFIASHVMIGGGFHLQRQLSDKTVNRRFRQLAGGNAAVLTKLAENGRRRHPRIVFFQIPDLGLKIVIQFAWLATVRPGRREQAIKALIQIIAVPVLDRLWCKVPG